MYVETEREISVRSVQNYLDCGIMQADIKPVKLENGEALVENGKIYLTYTSRFEEQMMQQIASYKLSTGELALEGALLFDCGDGAWCGDVATTLRAGHDIRHGLIGAGVYASHGYERSHVDGAVATLKVLAGYIG